MGIVFYLFAGLINYLIISIFLCFVGTPYTLYFHYFVISEHVKLLMIIFLSFLVINENYHK